MGREIQSPVTGTVWKIEVPAGGQADAGDDLIIVESMKMEIPVVAFTKLIELAPEAALAAEVWRVK